MLNKFLTLLLFVIFITSGLFSQNTNETPNLSPDSNKTNNLSIPTGGGGGISTESPLVEPTTLEKEISSPPELEMKEAPSPVPNSNKMEEESIQETEEAPSRSEPVPGAEILIEQEQNDIQNQPPPLQPTEKNKEKKKSKNKPNK